MKRNGLQYLAKAGGAGQFCGFRTTGKRKATLLKRYQEVLDRMAKNGMKPANICRHYKLPITESEVYTTPTKKLTGVISTALEIYRASPKIRGAK